MAERRRTRAPVLGLLTLVVACVAGGLALQLLSGGIRLRSLSPALLALVLAVLGSVVVTQRPQLRLGPVLVVNGVVFGLGSLAAGVLDYGSRHALPGALAHSAFAVVWLTLTMNAAWALFVLWFPDGRFVSRAWRRFFFAAAAACVALALAAWIAGAGDEVSGFYAGTTVPHGAGGPLADAWPPLSKIAMATLLFPVIALASVVQRRRTASTVVRQQIRWLFAALCADIAVQVATAPLVDRPGALGAAASALAFVATPLPVIAAAIAILRYRLWEIDVVVSRAFVYGVLWLALSALLLVPGVTAGLLVGGRDAFAAVGLALVVTLAFQPLRTRLERIAERLVYRHRASPYAVLTDFWSALRAPDLDQLGRLLADALRERLGVSWAGVWLRSDCDGPPCFEPLGVAGTDVRPPVAVAAELERELTQSGGMALAASPPAALAPLWDEPPALVVPLVAAERLVGLIACGERRRDPLAARDFELVELLARDCALRLRNLRLEAELRGRLAQIEAQADALLLSRRRLVAAQDDERRRIERNLHDGVQQQLVALAIRLRQAAAGDPLLADLADEAEQSVFALQELARGIFPGVLIDQGLPAALRAQAGRMPLAVRVEVDPALAGARLDLELEAALYFVALEALTNVQKHAPDATTAVWLRAAGPDVVLEVVDDGPGFERRRGEGSGLQNMEDRMAAAGGTLTIDATPGGTLVRARARARRVRASARAGLAQVDQHGGHAPVELGLGGEV